MIWGGKDCYDYRVSADTPTDRRTTIPYLTSVACKGFSYRCKVKPYTKLRLIPIYFKSDFLYNCFI